MVALSVMFYEPTRGAFPKQPRNSLLNDHSTMHRTNYLVTTVSRSIVTLSHIRRLNHVGLTT